MNREQVLFVLNNPDKASAETLKDACFNAAQLLIQRDNKLPATPVDPMELSPPARQLVDAIGARLNALAHRLSTTEHLLANACAAYTHLLDAACKLCVVANDLDLQWRDKNGSPLEENPMFASANAQIGEFALAALRAKAGQEQPANEG